MMRNPIFKQTIRNYFVVPLAGSVVGAFLGFSILWYAMQLFGFDCAKLWPVSVRTLWVITFFFMLAYRHARLTYQNLSEQNLWTLSPQHIVRIYGLLITFYITIFYWFFRTNNTASTSLMYGALMCGILVFNMWTVERDLRAKATR